jgi:hypothetical protein
MGIELKRSHYVTVTPRFLRSVNLHDDWRNIASASGYVVTPNVAQALEQMSEGLLSENGQRAFALIGAYGSGKSAFAVFLCQLLDRNPGNAAHAAKMLGSEYAKLDEAFRQIRKTKNGREGFLLIPVTARRRPIAQLLLEGMLEAVRGMASSASVRDLYIRLEEAILQKAWQDTAIVVAFLADVQEEAKKQFFAGVLLLVDEAGKTLEYALQDRSGGDVYIFQELAEYACRQSETPLLFLITMHRMFDDYVELSDRTLHNEWNKVQERFQSIQFSESAGTTIRLIASALHPTNDLPKPIVDELDDALLDIQNGAIPLPFGLGYAEFANIARRAWPLHPSLLLAMPYLFRRLAQNERSIFSYLSSSEPFAFQYHLDCPVEGNDNFIRLHHIYVYLLANFESWLVRLPHAKRLLEANDIINSRQYLSHTQLEIVKTVALLNVLSEICPLRATEEMLRCAVSSPRTLDQDLNFLKQQSVLTYRRLDHSYRVWEGSDVDIEARMNEGRQKLQIESTSPLAVLCHHLPAKTIIARRHSLKTGVNRYFNLMYAESLGKGILKEVDRFEGAAGTIVVLLPQANMERLKADALEATKEQKRLIIALPTQIDVLRGVAEEVASLRWVEKNTPELRDDRVARRELSLRLAMGEQYMAKHIQTLLDPRPAPVGNACRWIWNGQDQQPQNPTDVTKLLSKVCDHIYSLTPMVRNELVVRKKLSSVASSARRCLLERMLEKRSEECLGIQGYPPERSLYESVLRASGIHFFDENRRQWDFGPPSESNRCNLRPSWDLIEAIVFAENIQRIELVDLFEQLANVPYGLPDGIHPIIFVAFYLHYQDELFLYREGTFIPEVKSAHLELLQRRPDLFSVSGAKLDGIRKAVVERLAKGLKQAPKTGAVVRALYRVLNALPLVTQKTSRIENVAAVKMRDCLLHAAAPEELLFVELPRCFGLQPFMQGQDRESDMDYFFEKLNDSLSALNSHAQKLLEDKRNALLRHCGLAENVDGWSELERRAVWLAPRVNHEVLTAFLNCVNNGVRPTLSLIANRAFEQWTDMYSDNFEGLAKGMGELFQRTWLNYGDAGYVLTGEDLKQKEPFRIMLELKLGELREKGNSIALAAAVRELLITIESNQN